MVLGGKTGSVANATVWKWLEFKMVRLTVKTGRKLAITEEM